MQLSEYLESNDISVAEFARLIRAKSRATVHRYINDDDPVSRRIPSPEMMQRIHQATGGKVTANDFYMNGHAKPSDKRKRQ